ncbi:MAG: hypothetical protein QM811_26035 [Pirellulales bacterium]
MPSNQDTPAILDRVRQLLSEGKAEGIHLRVTGSRFDDDWLYLVVEPTGIGERASQHAHFMTKIERTLQKEGFDQVLIVPAVPEHAGLIDVPPATP